MQINKKRAALLLAGAALLVYLPWLFLRPVEIVAAHHKNGFTDLLVKNFPFTDRGKINWWLENHAMLKEKYNAPYLDEDGTFWATIFLFGDGYQKDIIDERLCFDEIKSELRCIDKNAVMTVFSNRYNQVFFRVSKGKYILRKNGEIDKVE
ncbi:hypothetical protein B1H58_17105 [Pantoea alhagi]|uniref:DUF943 domain-containing protein n=1 Tax=Pantoea alhagi TaxID=1891675 RepID=A0A1W6B932_9GAMM|nr:DUF943 family protein [Pantoea alhagi]ARJ43590.1 hypothetical protein B1H58_17105 [Pantoea alhagi]